MIGWKAIGDQLSMQVHMVLIGKHILLSPRLCVRIRIVILTLPSDSCLIFMNGDMAMLSRSQR